MSIKVVRTEAFHSSMQEPDKSKILIDGIGIIIPNYNGETFITKTVTAAKRALDHLDAPGAIYVVDDASSDQSVTKLKEDFGEDPFISIIQRGQNGGFVEACWTGAQANIYNAVLFLNSDVQIYGDALAYFWKEFTRSENGNVFALTGNYVDEKGEPVLGSLERGLFNSGLLRIRSTIDPHLRCRKTSHFYANGGFSVFNTRLFIELGGFPPLYRPFYGEDVDLSLRALRRGYTNLYIPEAKGVHEGSKTIKKYYSSKLIKEIGLINRFLLVWIHMDSAQLWIQHVFGILFRLAGAFLTFNLVFPRAFIKALRRTGQVIEERRKMGPAKIPLSTILRETSRWASSPRSAS